MSRATYEAYELQARKRSASADGAAPRGGAWPLPGEPDPSAGAASRSSGWLPDDPPDGGLGTSAGPKGRRRSPEGSSGTHPPSAGATAPSAAGATAGRWPLRQVPLEGRRKTQKPLRSMI